ncbi:mechanosensitive ion channel family protein [Sphingobacterium sp. UBA6645]|uniref:mechanosensitive ion channel family protein n=1 Tax=Sphingobacterium sp. UBA6645 TaxID=1947511 RepID=UPI0025F1562A|nr:mechanosensitive ion channel family protein [Sphingobacterium sp. UBA6645]
MRILTCLSICALQIVLFTFSTFAQTADSITSSSNSEDLLLKESKIQTQRDSTAQAELLKAIADIRARAAEAEAEPATGSRARKSDSLKRASLLSKINNLRSTTPGYPVQLYQDTLFSIYTRIGSFDAKDRAAAISHKIYQLFDAPDFNPDFLNIVENEESYDIVYNGENIIISVRLLDALWVNKSSNELAESYIAKIRESVVKQREAHSLLNLAKRIGLALLVLLLMTGMVILINRFFKFLAGKISVGKDRVLSARRMRKLKIIKAEHIEQAMLRMNTILRVLILFLSIYLTLPLLFSIFPETESWTGMLLGWILSPLKAVLLAIIDYLSNLFRVAVIFLIFKYLVKFTRYVFHELQRGNIHLSGFHADWALPTFNILRFVLYAFMMVLIFPYLPGSSSPAFQGVTVFIGILVSLGSSNAIANVVAGLVITYMRPFQIGDRVKIGEAVGDVLEKSMLVTRIKTIKNEEITVPNSMVLSSTTVNYSNQSKKEQPGLIVHYSVTIGDDVPWQKVYTLLKEAASQTIHIETHPEPFVLQTNLNDFNISYTINAYTKQPSKQALIYSNLLENIQEVFHREQIELLSPSYHVMNKLS